MASISGLNGAAMASPVCGVLLAAGAARRFGGDKLLAELKNGEQLGLVSAQNLLPHVDRMLVVIRPGDTEIEALYRRHGFATTVAVNADQGMGRSLAHGISASGDCAGWIVALADMPFIAADTYRCLREALDEGAGIAAPLYETMRGNPVAFSARYRKALVALEGDTGARELVRSEAVTLIDVNDPGILRDIDVPSDLETG